MADIIDSVAPHGPARLAVVVEDTSLAKTTVFRLLQSLERARLMFKTEGGYVLLRQWASPAERYEWLKSVGEPIWRKTVERPQAYSSVCQIDAYVDCRWKATSRCDMY